MSSVWAPVVGAKGQAIVAEMELYGRGMDAMWVWLYYVYGFEFDPVFAKEKFSWLDREYAAFRKHPQAADAGPFAVPDEAVVQAQLRGVRQGAAV
jgi:hypothetical protein